MPKSPLTEDLRMLKPKNDSGITENIARGAVLLAASESGKDFLKTNMDERRLSIYDSGHLSG